ncbi:peroxiredoxin family protein [Parvularcula sp. ZS-1/3]|uniref:thioredoxin-dependent peroxiredoxin n=1 Tax=Parvularcula mediterranea TaxID=2732508 RepID=A0A7Y3RNJ1_9PROT|nr:redoxin domain-containing protein [Parvularcula mediterranea]NNU17359.1 peroxiredoxin family protein [Parvularcula mediterranea]
MVIALLLSLFMQQGLGPDIGTKVPEPAQFEDAMGDRGATIVFVRSVDWCPFCKRQVKELADASEAFDAAGRPLIFISYDDAAKQESFAERLKIEETFIADEGSALIKAFGILNTSHQPGSRVYGIPHPAVFVVDRDGVVKARLYEEDFATNSKSYRNRPAVDTILEAAKTKG